MQTDLMRRISYQATQQGVAEVTAGLKGLAAAQNDIAVTSEKMTKSQLSVQSAFERQQRSLDISYRTTQQFEKAQRTLDQALQQGITTQARHAELTALNATRHDQLANSQKALGVITSDLNGRVQAAAGSFGVVGQALSALGPIGLTAAAVLGTAVIGFNLASNAAHELAGKAKELREFAEATGLTTQQVQALKSEAGKFGIDSETLSSGIQKFTTGFQQLRLGTGDLLTQIRRINPALADQIQGAQDAATAFTLFGQAVSQTDNIFQRNALLKAGMGKGSAIFGEFFASAPDVSALTNAFTAAGRGLDDNLIKKLSTLQVEIDKTKSAASTIFASIFSENVLKAEKEFAGVLLDISKTLKLISETKFPDVPDWVKTAGRAALNLTPAGNIVAGVSALKGAVSSGASTYDRQQPFPAGGDPMAASSYGGAAGALKITSQLTPDALAAKLRDLVAVLGSAASPSEKLNAAIAELGIKARDAGIGADVLARGVAGLKLDNAVALQSAHNAALGQAVTVTDLVKAKTLELAVAQRAGAGLTKDQIAFQIQYARESAIGITQIKGQIDAENVRAATLLMSNEAAIAYSIVQTRINEAKLRGAPLTEAEIAGLQKEADAYARINVSVNRYAQALQDVKQVGAQFANDFVQGLVSGKSAMDALTASAASLGRSLVNAGINNIIKDPTSAIGYIELGVGLVTQLITGQSEAQKKAEEELQRAKAAWAAMADQVRDFNRAADGFNLGPLTSAIVQLRTTFETLADAANKAKDYQGLLDLEATFNRGVARTVAEFVNGTPIVSDLGQKMKSVSDEGQGLIETLKQYGIATISTGDILEAVTRQQQALRDATEQGLISDIRNNSGVGYLSTIGDAINRFNDLIAQGVSSGVSSAWLYSTAQAAIDGAKLQGAAYQELIQLYPQLTAVTHAFIDAEGAAAKAAADATQKLNLQLRLLTATTDASTLGGALTLFDARAKQERDAAIAAGIALENLALLDASLAAERLHVVNDFGQKAIEEEKRLADARLSQMQRIQEYLDNLTGGSNSTLSPVDRLSAASSQYSTQLTAARGGDASALGNITSYSQNVLDAARSYYGSTAGYQSIFAQIQNDLRGLIALTGAGAATSATSSALSGIGVSSISAAPAASNTNSWADLKASMDAMKTEIVTLRTELKTVISAGNASNAQGQVEEIAKLDSIDGKLTSIRDDNALAASGSR